MYIIHLFAIAIVMVGVNDGPLWVKGRYFDGPCIQSIAHWCVRAGLEKNVFVKLAFMTCKGWCLRVEQNQVSPSVGWWRNTKSTIIAYMARDICQTL